MLKEEDQTHLYLVPKTNLVFQIQVLLRRAKDKVFQAAAAVVAVAQMLVAAVGFRPIITKISGNRHYQLIMNLINKEIISNRINKVEINYQVNNNNNNNNLDSNINNKHKCSIKICKCTLITSSVNHKLSRW